jgi:hypothetical protein
MERSQGFGVMPAMPEVQSVQSYVVFDPTDGTILHTHECVTLEGADVDSGYDVEQRALSLAADIRELELSTLAAIHVAPEELILRPDRFYAVDVDKLALVQRRDPPPLPGYP